MPHAVQSHLHRCTGQTHRLPAPHLSTTAGQVASPLRHERDLHGRAQRLGARELRVTDCTSTTVRDETASPHPARPRALSLSLGFAARFAPHGASATCHVHPPTRGFFSILPLSVELAIAPSGDPTSTDTPRSLHARLRWDGGTYHTCEPRHVSRTAVCGAPRVVHVVAPAVEGRVVKVAIALPQWSTAIRCVCTVIKLCTVESSRNHTTRAAPLSWTLCETVSGRVVDRRVVFTVGGAQAPEG